MAADTINALRIIEYAGRKFKTKNLEYKIIDDMLQVMFNVQYDYKINGAVLEKMQELYIKEESVQ